MLDMIKQEAEQQYNKVLSDTGNRMTAATSAIGVFNYHLQVLDGSDIRRKHIKDAASKYLMMTVTATEDMRKNKHTASNK